ncbi:MULTISPECIES: hypothetical protein [Pacificibacter]|uniref:hypothetical protein n=1 Tax=Pacificibacter TaxID=1042323 RepID=UPI001C099E45|nr:MULTISPECIES: hypothetical protein [Pacificibacter]MBU2935500.1 hypothetical protein [Pacificibacter marinus]MDO6613997.1 hypothetical protein [Pacificibacter sp. 1_MG-2023]
MCNETKKTVAAISKPRSTHMRSALPTMALVAMFAASCTSQVSAQEQHGPNPMDGVAEALNLEPEQLRGCLGEPPARGTQPSDSDRMAMITCLQGQNASLTAEQIDTAMQSMHDAHPPKSRS